MNPYSPQIRVGLLGGGQLARLLAMSAWSLGLEPHVYSPSADDPAAQVTKFWHQGSLDDPQSMAQFFKKVDHVTFESEFVSPDVIRQARPKKGVLQPPLSALEQIQDRLPQKKLLDQFKVPTAPWLAPQSFAACEAWMKDLDTPVVFKKRRFGYDGYGTFVVKNKKQWEHFKKQHSSIKDFIVEQWIPFKRELAIIVGRNPEGQKTHFPLVESFQKDSRCYWVKGPIKSQKLDRVIRPLWKMLEGVDYVGVMGVEFFEHAKTLLVNELAPRVHNTGHYTLDTAGPSQFDIHWRCILNHKLPKKIDTGSGFAMVNLLSEGPRKPHLNNTLQEQPHWYGKTDHRLGRKMGHINAQGSSPSLALKKALRAEKGFQI